MCAPGTNAIQETQGQQNLCPHTAGQLKTPATPILAECCRKDRRSCREHCYKKHLYLPWLITVPLSQNSKHEQAYQESQASLTWDPLMHTIHLSYHRLLPDKSNAYNRTNQGLTACQTPNTLGLDRLGRTTEYCSIQIAHSKAVGSRQARSPYALRFEVSNSITRLGDPSW